MKKITLTFASLLLVAATAFAAPPQAQNPCNPCAKKAANPCAGKTEKAKKGKSHNPFHKKKKESKGATNPCNPCSKKQ